MLQKELKFNLMMYTFIFFSLVVMLIGTTYSYYTNKSENKENEKLVIKTANMLLRYTDGAELNVSNVLPGFSDNYIFSIENYSNDVDGKYRIILDIIEPLLDSTDENFVFSLSGQSNRYDDNGYVTYKEDEIPIESIELGIALIPSKTLHTYKLNLKLKDNNMNQNYLSGKSFKAKIRVESVYN